MHIILDIDYLILLKCIIMNALGSAIQENLMDRNDIFLISKVDNSNQGYKNTITSFYDSLSKLKTDYLDAFLIH